MAALGRQHPVASARTGGERESWLRAAETDHPTQLSDRTGPLDVLRRDEPMGRGDAAAERTDSGGRSGLVPGHAPAVDDGAADGGDRQASAVAGDEGRRAGTGGQPEASATVFARSFQEPGQAPGQRGGAALVGTTVQRIGRRAGWLRKSRASLRLSAPRDRYRGVAIDGSPKATEPLAGRYRDGIRSGGERGAGDELLRQGGGLREASNGVRRRALAGGGEARRLGRAQEGGESVSHEWSADATQAVAVGDDSGRGLLPGRGSLASAPQDSVGPVGSGVHGAEAGGGPEDADMERGAGDGGAADGGERASLREDAGSSRGHQADEATESESSGTEGSVSQGSSSETSGSADSDYQSDSSSSSSSQSSQTSSSDVGATDGSGSSSDAVRDPTIFGRSRRPTANRRGSGRDPVHPELRSRVERVRGDGDRGEAAEGALNGQGARDPGRPAAASDQSVVHDSIRDEVSEDARIGSARSQTGIDASRGHVVPSDLDRSGREVVEEVRAHGEPSSGERQANALGGSRMFSGREARLRPVEPDGEVMASGARAQPSSLSSEIPERTGSDDTVARAPRPAPAELRAGRPDVRVGSEEDPEHMPVDEPVFTTPPRGNRRDAWAHDEDGSDVPSRRSLGSAVTYETSSFDSQAWHPRSAAGSASPSDPSEIEIEQTLREWWRSETTMPESPRSLRLDEAFWAPPVTRWGSPAHLEEGGGDGGAVDGRPAWEADEGHGGEEDGSGGEARAWAEWWAERWREVGIEPDAAWLAVEGEDGMIGAQRAHSRLEEMARRINLVEDLIRRSESRAAWGDPERIRLPLERAEALRGSREAESHGDESSDAREGTSEWVDRRTALEALGLGGFRSSERGELHDVAEGVGWSHPASGEVPSHLSERMSDHGGADEALGGAEGTGLGRSPGASGGRETSGGSEGERDMVAAREGSGRRGSDSEPRSGGLGEAGRPVRPGPHDEPDVLSDRTASLGITDRAESTSSAGHSEEARRDSAAAQTEPLSGVKRDNASTQLQGHGEPAAGGSKRARVGVEGRSSAHAAREAERGPDAPRDDEPDSSAGTGGTRASSGPSEGDGGRAGSEGSSGDESSGASSTAGTSGSQSGVTSSDTSSEEIQDNGIHAILRERLPSYGIPEPVAEAFSSWIGRNWRDARPGPEWSRLVREPEPAPALDPPTGIGIAQLGETRSFFREFLGWYGAEVGRGPDPAAHDPAAEWEERQRAYPGGWWDDSDMPPLPGRGGAEWRDETSSSDRSSVDLSLPEERSVEDAAVLRYQLWDVSPIESTLRTVPRREPSPESPDEPEVPGSRESVARESEESRSIGREWAPHETSGTVEDPSSSGSEGSVSFRRSGAPSPGSGEHGSAIAVSGERSGPSRASGSGSSEPESSSDPRSSSSEASYQRAVSVSWSASRSWSDSSEGGREASASAAGGTNRSSWHGSAFPGRLEQVRSDPDLETELQRFEAGLRGEHSEPTTPSSSGDRLSDHPSSRGATGEGPGAEGSSFEHPGPVAPHGGSPRAVDESLFRPSDAAHGGSELTGLRPTDESGRAGSAEPVMPEPSAAGAQSREVQDDLIRASLEENIVRYGIREGATRAFAQWIARNWREAHADESWFQMLDALRARRPVARRLLDEFDAQASAGDRAGRAGLAADSDDGTSTPLRVGREREERGWRSPPLRLEWLDHGGRNERLLRLADLAGLEPDAVFDLGRTQSVDDDLIALIWRRGEWQDEEWARILDTFGTRPHTPERVVDELDAAVLRSRRPSEARQPEQVETAQADAVDPEQGLLDVRYGEPAGTPPSALVRQTWQAGGSGSPADVGTGARGAVHEAHQAFVERNVRAVMEFAPHLSEGEAIEYLERLAARVAEEPDLMRRLPWVAGTRRASSAPVGERERSPWLSRITEETTASRSVSTGDHQSDERRITEVGAESGSDEDSSAPFAAAVRTALEEMPPHLRLILHRELEIDHGVFDQRVLDHPGSPEPRSETGDITRMVSRSETAEGEGGVEPHSRASSSAQMHVDHEDSPHRAGQEGGGAGTRTTDHPDGERGTSHEPEVSGVRRPRRSSDFESARPTSDDGMLEESNGAGHDIGMEGPGRLGPEAVGRETGAEASSHEPMQVVDAFSPTVLREHAEPGSFVPGDLSRPATPVEPLGTESAPSPSVLTERPTSPGLLADPGVDAPVGSPDALPEPLATPSDPSGALVARPTSAAQEPSEPAEAPPRRGDEGDTYLERFPAGQSDARSAQGESDSRSAVQDDLLRDALRTALPLYGVTDDAAWAFSNWAARNWREAQGVVEPPSALLELRPDGSEAMGGEPSYVIADNGLEVRPDIEQHIQAIIFFQELHALIESVRRRAHGD